MDFFVENQLDRFDIRKGKSYPFPSHLHTAFECHYIVEGTQHITVDGVEYTMHEGDFSFVFPEVVHSYVKHDEGTPRAIIMIVSPSYLGTHMQAALSLIPNQPVIPARLVHPDIPYALNRLLELNKELNEYHKRQEAEAGADRDDEEKKTKKHKHKSKRDSKSESSADVNANNDSTKDATGNGNTNAAIADDPTAVAVAKVTEASNLVTNMTDAAASEDITASEVDAALAFEHMLLHHPTEQAVTDEAAVRLLRESLVQLIFARSLPFCNIVKRSAHNQPDMLHMVVTYIAKNYRKDITLESMAADLGYSTFTLSRVFSGTLGMNFNKYVNGLRAEYACVRLRGTEDSITDICYDSGFNSQRTFNRVFQDIFEMSPAEYRKYYQSTLTGLN